MNHKNQIQEQDFLNGGVIYEEEQGIITTNVTKMKSIPYIAIFFTLLNISWFQINYDTYQYLKNRQCEPTVYYPTYIPTEDFEYIEFIDPEDQWLNYKAI